MIAATVERVMPTAASARLWRTIFGTSLALGLLAASQTLWVVGADLLARRSWPQANGTITSISEESSAGIARASRRTRYWVRYGVRFSVPAGQCRTGLVEPNDDGLINCIGSVSTRTTLSTFAAGSWMRQSLRSTAVRSNGGCIDRVSARAARLLLADAKTRRPFVVNAAVGGPCATCYSARRKTTVDRSAAAATSRAE